jgi:DNA repair protein RadC
MPEKERERNLHAGHRARLKARAAKNGLDSFDDHQILELLLFYVIPRKDTNPIAHRLLNKFRTLQGVFEATREQLLEVEGIGEKAADFLRFIPGISRRYLLSRQIKSVRLSSTSQIGDFMAPYFIGKTEETVYMLCLDARNMPISCEQIHTGTATAVEICTPKIVAEALKKNAVSVVLAHNHPKGFSIPSSNDIAGTLAIKDALEKVRIRLIDHIIISDPLNGSDGVADFVSMADTGLFLRQEPPDMPKK